MRRCSYVTGPQTTHASPAQRAAALAAFALVLLVGRPGAADEVVPVTPTDGTPRISAQVEGSIERPKIHPGDLCPTCPPPVPCPAVGAPCEPETVAPALFYQKAMQWMGSDKRKHGTFLMRNIARDYPESPYGRKAASFLADEGDLNRDGRVEFIIGSSLMGAYFGYTAVIGSADDAFDDDTAWKTAAWTALGGGLVGVGASAWASQYMSISNSQATLYNFSGSWGFLNGFLVYDMIWPLESNDALVAGALGMAAGVGASLALWPYLDVDEGAAQMSVTMAAYSLELIALTSVMIGGAEVYRDNETAALLGLLIPSNAAAVGGYFLGRELKWSASDIRYISLGGVLGNLLGMALVTTTVGSDSSVASVAGTMAGSVVAGLVGGTLIVRPWQHSGQASRDELPFGAGLVHLDEDGVAISAPMPVIKPATFKGRYGYEIDLPLLTSSL